MQIQQPQFIWKHLIIQGEPPQPRYGHSAIFYQNSMIIFGGQWSQITPSGTPPAARCHH